MRDRLDVESAELAARFRSLDGEAQADVAARMLQRALDDLAAPVELPEDAIELDALVEALDRSEIESDFRRARAAMAARFLRQGACDDALYEALHARDSTREAVDEALSELRERAPAASEASRP